MGDWNITIQGVGPHHNDKPDIDVDWMAKEFVKQLKKAGQTIKCSSITYGGAHTLRDIND